MKNAKIEPYLFFNGRCEEALVFYESTLGAERVMLMRFKDSPDTPPPGMIPDNWGDKVMHAVIQIDRQVIMLSDGCQPDGGFSGFSLSLTLPDATTCEKTFTALSEGGKVTLPLSKTFFSPCFGMVTDKFGLGWMITVSDNGC